MPNWTTTRMVVHKDDVADFVNEVGNVDFGIFRPIPRSLLLLEGSFANDAESAAHARKDGDSAALVEIAEKLAERLGEGIDFSRDTDSTRIVRDIDGLCDVGDLYLENKRLHGFRSWYGWSTENWGTKWNACDTSVKPLGETAVVVEFDTAWNAPDESLCGEILRACKHPALMEHADEDFCGVYSTRLGEDGSVERCWLDDLESDLFEVHEDPDDGFHSFSASNPKTDWPDKFVAPERERDRTASQGSPDETATAARKAAAATGGKRTADTGKHL